MNSDPSSSKAMVSRLYRENMKKSSWPRVLIFGICSITSWTSTSFVQIMPLWPKMARPQGSHGWHWLNRKTWKNITVWILYQVYSNYAPGAKNDLPQHKTNFFRIWSCCISNLIDDHYMGLDARNPIFRVCEQQRRRPDCASSQFDQRLWYGIRLWEGIISRLATSNISIF